MRVNTISISLRQNLRIQRRELCWQELQNVKRFCGRYGEVDHVWRLENCWSRQPFLSEKLSFFQLWSITSQWQIGACTILGQYLSCAPSSFWCVEVSLSADHIFQSFRRHLQVEGGLTADLGPGGGAGTWHLADLCITLPHRWVYCETKGTRSSHALGKGVGINQARAPITQGRLIQAEDDGACFTHYNNDNLSY